MGLEFSPLGWVYHDGWNWKETKLLVSFNSKGEARIIDKSKQFYQMGHCHLFLTDFDVSKASSSLAYWGTQDYSFQINDEWGPNSNDPNQIKTIRLLGKPIWYFYVEEYWRRMYIQPWSKVDNTCRLPLNQSIVYDKYTLSAYFDKVITENNWLNSSNNNYNDGNWGSYSEYYIRSYVGFTVYLTMRRRMKARKLWAEQYMTGYDEKNTTDQQIINYITQERDYAENPSNFYWELYDGDLNNTTINNQGDYNIYTNYVVDDVVLFNNNYWKCIKENNGNPPPNNSSFNYKQDFEDFYRIQAEKHEGYVNRLDAMKEFLSIKGFSYQQYKQDVDGNIFIPQDKTQGHVGIKYDASLPCHSLGPFREGGGLYFFNTVVNRTMPVEYWLDEDKKTRQYYIKQKDSEDTTGGGTWSFADDNTHFIWVYDNFDEMKDSKYGWGNEWESDGFQKHDGYRPRYDVHRLRNINCIYGDYYTYLYAGQNAKRLKTDRHIYMGEQDWYIPQLQHTEKQLWFGTNEKVLHNDYDEQGYAEKVNNFTDIEKGNITTDKDGNLVYGENMGYYDDTGYHQKQSTSDEILYDPKQSGKLLFWEQRMYDGWTGWYEYNEIIKCHHNNTFYKRKWKPYGYKEADPYDQQIINSYESDEEEPVSKGNAPHWSRKKRQSFPNPPPYLCDENYKPKREQGKRYKHFAVTPDVYDEDEANRIHLLHWEYCHYYNLIRYYSYYSYSVRYWVYDVPAQDTYSGTAEKYYSSYPKHEEDYNPDQWWDEEEWYEYVGRFKNYNYKVMAGDWETAIDMYVEENGAIKSIEEENTLFNQFISTLPLNPYAINSDSEEITCLSPLYYQDYYIYHHDNRYYTFDYKGTPCSIGGINDNGAFWSLTEIKNVDNLDQLLQNAEYVVNYNGGYYYEGEQYLTYISFNQFIHIWEPLTQQEQKKLNLFGDYPQRNETPYPVPTFDEAFGDEDPNNKYVMADGEEEFKINSLNELQENSLNEAASSLLYSAFFPRIDMKTREQNDARANSSQEPPLPSFKLSKLDQVDNIPMYEPIDPYRNGTVNPIENWKKYFNKREVYTIPKKTTVGGDYPITSDYVTPHKPWVHPRELSYCAEDGARRYFPNDKFISPIIEYQKIIRLNWERLPGNQQDENYLQNNWQTAKNCNWGDGFSTSISIPFKINNEIQSPFSDASKVTRPIGEYCHNCVKPEKMYRYKIDFYDSLDKIRRYDFPNYVNIIHNFQMEHLPEDTLDDSYIDENGDTIIGTSYESSYYQEDFNNYESTLDMRKNDNYKDPISGLKWSDLLDAYFNELDEIHNFSNNPIVRNHDCYGNQIQENTFVKLNNGKFMWRSEVTNLLPTIDKVEYTTDDAGNEVPGYRSSTGEIIKGGKVVEWKDPYNQKDGKWVEQCLGAIVRVKCVQVLEDTLGYRWMQETTETAMQPEDELKGMDYDSPQ